MNKTTIAITIALLLSGCLSTKQYNKALAEKRSVNELQSDIDFLHRKLERYHPQLYLYISKSELDYKFDSLKSTIKEPMTSREFYYKVAPVVASIKQGHSRLFQSTKDFTSKEIKQYKINSYGKTPLAKMNFGVFNDKLFVLGNDSWNKAISPGTEVVSINGIATKLLLDKYKTTFASDGFNTTFKDRMLSKRFHAFLLSDFDFTDSLTCSVRVADSLATMVLLRQKPIDTTKRDSIKAAIKKSLTAAQKDSVKIEKRKKKYLGYNYDEKSFSKSLTFLEADSSIALLHIGDFSQGQYKKFYKNTFKTLDSLKTETLIIDLRNNLGGRADEIKDLYSYLADTNFVFIDKSEIVSPKSMLFTAFFKGKSVLFNVLTFPIYPIYAGVALTRLSKDNDKYFFRLGVTKKTEPKANRFKGKVYVLINGASFSASCTISSNLKGSKRAIFVGEETGGGYNGTVAGIMPVFTLPNTKLKVKFGLMTVDSHHKTDVFGHGIYPDVPITPTLDDFLNGNDPEVKWVVDKVKSEKAAKQVTQE